MKTPSNRYWVKRAEQLERDIQNGVNVSIEELVTIYNKTLDDITAEIRKIKNRFMIVGDINEDELNRYITKAEKDIIGSELKLMYNSTSNTLVREELKKRINAQAYRYRITRLEAVENKVYNIIKQSAIKELSITKQRYEDSFKASYYRTIEDVARGFDVGVSFTMLPQKAIDKALETRWSGKNFSQRIWANSDELAKKAQEVIVSGLKSGSSIPKMAKQLEGLKLKGEHGATRLVRTEANYFMNQGELKGYKEAGFKKYKFIATLDYRTSTLCQDLDGTVHEVKNAVVNENYPPMHPYCRSTTIQGDIETGGTTRIARDPLTGKNYKVDKDINFKEWYKSLSDEQKQALKQARNIDKNKSSEYD